MDASATLQQPSAGIGVGTASGGFGSSALGPLPIAPGHEPADRHSRFRAIIIFVLSILAVICVGLGDLFTAPDASSSILYLLPVSLAAWYSGRIGGFTVAVVAATLWFLAEKYHVTPTRTQFIFLWNAFSRLAVFLYVVLVIYQLHKTKTGLERTVRERTQKLEMEIAQRLAVQGEIAAISDREQERIGHELHDGLCQYLTGIGFRAKALEQMLDGNRSPQTAEAQELAGLIRDAIRQARNLARGLDPIELENGDLIAALQSLTAETERVFQITCSFEHSDQLDELQLKRSAALGLYRICQEAMNNAAKHGGAKNIEIELRSDEDTVHLRIQDDGGGIPSEPRPGHKGMGIRIMRFRAEAIGGSLSISSTRGQGTTVTCTAPRQRVALNTATPNPHQDVRTTKLS